MKYLVLILVLAFSQSSFAEGGSCLHHSIETGELTSCWYYQPEFNFHKSIEKICLKHNEREDEKYTKSSWSGAICSTKKLISVCHAKTKYEAHLHMYEHSESNKAHIYGFFCLENQTAKTFNNEFYKSVKVEESVEAKKKTKKKNGITAKSKGLDVLLQLNEIRKVSKLMETYKASKGQKNKAIAAMNTSFGGAKIRKINKETARSILASLENCISKKRVSFGEEVNKGDCPIVQTQNKLADESGKVTTFLLSDNSLIDLFVAHNYECNESDIIEQSEDKHLNVDCTVLTKDFGVVKMNYKGVRFKDRNRVETYNIAYNNEKINYIVEYEDIKLSKFTLNGVVENIGWSMNDKRLDLLPTKLLPVNPGRL